MLETIGRITKPSVAQRAFGRGSRVGRVRPSPKLHAWLKPVADRPAYYDVLSRLDVEERTAEELKELTRIDTQVAARQEMTWKSALAFFPGFITFHVIPMSIRYTWYRFWKCLRNQFLYPLQKRWAMMDAHLDALLSFIGGNGAKFSVIMVFLRLHGKIGPGRECRYRWGLIRGKDVDHCKEFIKQRTLKAQPAVYREDDGYLIS